MILSHTRPVTRGRTNIKRLKKSNVCVADGIWVAQTGILTTRESFTRPPQPKPQLLVSRPAKKRISRPHDTPAPRLQLQTQGNGNGPFITKVTGPVDIRRYNFFVPVFLLWQGLFFFFMISHKQVGTTDYRRPRAATDGSGMARAKVYGVN